MTNLEKIILDVYAILDKNTELDTQQYKGQVKKEINKRLEQLNIFDDNDKLVYWLLKEYKPHKLSKLEHDFCACIQTGYIARDESGLLYVFDTEPFKGRNEWEEDGIRIDKSLFPFITWDDEEPYSVEELLTWKVED